MTATEWLGMTALFGVMAFIIIEFVSWVLGFLVALKARPAARAAWITSIAYVAAIMILEANGMPEPFPLMVPFIALPGAALAYWIWYSAFRKAWIEDVENLAEGVTLANDDWRVGLVTLLALFIVAGFWVFSRYLLAG